MSLSHAVNSTSGKRHRPVCAGTIRLLINELATPPIINCLRHFSRKNVPKCSGSGKTSQEGGLGEWMGRQVSDFDSWKYIKSIN